MNIFYQIVIIIFAICILMCLIRSIFSKSVTGRIVSINMIGTQVIAIIAILSVMKKDSGLVDICLIYALISFLAVVVLVKVYTGIYKDAMRSKRRNKK